MIIVKQLSYLYDDDVDDIDIDSYNNINTTATTILIIDIYILQINKYNNNYYY